jgi:hypothetical protein
VKKDGAEVPVGFVGEICPDWADAASADPKKSIIAMIHARVRIPHLPHFVNCASVSMEHADDSQREQSVKSGLDL